MSRMRVRVLWVNVLAYALTLVVGYFIGRVLIGDWAGVAATMFMMVGVTAMVVSPGLPR